jgi:hypothetical protein
MDKQHVRLGEVSEYVRVMAPVFNARIGTEKRVYGRGQELYARVENLGTVQVRYGAPFAVERLVGSDWVRVGPENSVWPRYLAGLSAGGAGECMRFSIPQNFETGEYRLAKSISYGSLRSQETVSRYGLFTVE